MAGELPTSVLFPSNKMSPTMSPSLSATRWPSSPDARAPHLKLEVNPSQPSTAYDLDYTKSSAKITPTLHPPSQDVRLKNGSLDDTSRIGNEQSFANVSGFAPAGSKLRHSRKPSTAPLAKTGKSSTTNLHDPVPGTSQFPVRGNSSPYIPGAGRKGEPNHIPRPMNKWILFRQDYIRNRLSSASSSSVPSSSGSATHKTREQLKKELTEKWNNRTPEEDAYWSALAAQLKHNLMQEIPTYAYRPHPRGRGRAARSRSVSSRRPTTRTRPVPSNGGPVASPSSPTSSASTGRALSPSGDSEDGSCVCPPERRASFSSAELRRRVSESSTDVSLSPSPLISSTAINSERVYPTPRKTKRRSASVPEAWLAKLEEETELPRGSPASLAETSLSNNGGLSTLFDPGFDFTAQPRGGHVSSQGFYHVDPTHPLNFAATAPSTAESTTSPNFYDEHLAAPQPGYVLNNPSLSSLIGALGTPLSNVQLPRSVANNQPRNTHPRQHDPSFSSSPNSLSGPAAFHSQTADANDAARAALSDFQLGVNNRWVHRYDFDFFPRGHLSSSSTASAVSPVDKHSSPFAFEPSTVAMPDVSFGDISPNSSSPLLSDPFMSSPLPPSLLDCNNLSNHDTTSESWPFDTTTGWISPDPGMVSL